MGSKRIKIQKKVKKRWSSWQPLMPTTMCGQAYRPPFVPIHCWSFLTPENINAIRTCGKRKNKYSTWFMHKREGIGYNPHPGTVTPPENPMFLGSGIPTYTPKTDYTPSFATVLGGGPDQRYKRLVARISMYSLHLQKKMASLPLINPFFVAITCSYVIASGRWRGSLRNLANSHFLRASHYSSIPLSINALKQH